LIAGIGLYAAVVTALWALQRDLMYFPDGAPRVPPSSYGMLGGVQEVLLTTADALELAAWYVPAPPTRPTVVMSTVDVAALRFPIVPVAWLLADRFESLARIAAVDEPLLVMHGDRDFVIPQHLGRRLFAAAKEPKEAFWPTGVGHNNLFATGGFDTALDFIRGTMNVPSDTQTAPSGG
jgi:fermentation-respiration switch protein FrsA (DUF1100 family)